MKLHCIVEDADVARAAARGGATVIQLRLKDVSTIERIQRGRPVANVVQDAGVTFVVNDDVVAALALKAEGVHLGRSDTGTELAQAAELMLGLSAASVDEAIAAEHEGADYIGAGPVWATPTKPDADAPIGLGGLAAICEAVTVPVVAIGGIDATNAARCVEAGATGVAVVRASVHPRGVRRAVDAASR